MSSQRLLLVSAALIVDPVTGKLLVSRRRPGDSMPMMWEFPGGKVKTNESPEQAVVREIEEELGVILEDPVPWSFVSHPYPKFHLLMVVFRATRFRGKLTPLEVAELAWVTPAELATLPMPPADRPLVAELLARGV